MDWSNPESGCLRGSCVCVLVSLAISKECVRVCFLVSVCTQLLPYQGPPLHQQRTGSWSHWAAPHPLLAFTSILHTEVRSKFSMCVCVSMCVCSGGVLQLPVPSHCHGYRKAAELRSAELLHSLSLRLTQCVCEILWVRRRRPKPTERRRPLKEKRSNGPQAGRRRRMRLCC